MTRRTWTWLVPGVALLACIGVWFSHTLEYVRVWGWSGVEQELTGSVHLYMVPVGVALVLLVATAGAALARLHRLLSRRAARASGLLAGVWRARPDADAHTARARRDTTLSSGRLVLLLGAALATLQVGLYVIQENVESAVNGGPAPGLSVISGVHWAAPLIHAAVGLALAGISVGLWSLFRRRQVAVERLELAVLAVLAAVAARRHRPLLAPYAPLRVHGAPAYLGASIWCRPPPQH